LLAIFKREGVRKVREGKKEKEKGGIRRTAGRDAERVYAQ